MRCIIALLTIICMSCSSHEDSNDAKLKKDIIGEWYCDSEVYLVTDSTEKGLPPLPYLNRNGYSFSADNSFELKQGFHRILEFGDDNRTPQFVGYKTTFKIENDSLKIFNFPQNRWYSQKILKLTKDSLWLLRLNSLIHQYQYIDKYVRFQEKSRENLVFDKITLSSSGCLGFCPVLKISIAANGEARFLGQEHTTINGYFAANIPKEKLKDIFNHFTKVDLKTLPNDFDSHNSDDNTILISFWKDNKQIKAVRDYGRVSPSTFVCAYERLQNLYQELNWTAIDKKQFDEH